MLKDRGKLLASQSPSSNTRDSGTERDSSWDRTGTESLKTLARRRLARDMQRDIVTNQESHRQKSGVPSRNGFPSPSELAEICRRAVCDYPTIPAMRLQKFLEVAEDPCWCTEQTARLIAQRMSEGLITE